jgi:transcription elongation factor Elf1
MTQQPLMLCPFCGRAAVMVPGLHSSVVECRNNGCGVRPFAEAADITEAVAAWNTRADAALTGGEAVPSNGVVGQEVSRG